MILSKPLVLCVLDGWGMGGLDNFNAILGASPRNFQQLRKDYPSTKLVASGMPVGLPDGQMGNSEVGHMTIGSGRTITQDLVGISNTINTVLEGEAIKKLVASLRQTKKACHLVGLTSDGGIHSHINHMLAIAKHLMQEKVMVKVHLILDGRDTAPTVGEKFVRLFHDIEKANPLLSISTFGGRYFAMDRDNRFDRIEKAYKAIVQGQGELERFESALLSTFYSYGRGKSDEFIEPQVSLNYNGMEDGDAVIFCNFRSDRMRQICNAMLDPQFTGFKRGKVVKFSDAMTLTSYSEGLDKLATALFPQRTHKNTLFEVLHAHNIPSLRIAETEKYAHITYFFDAGRELQLPSSKKILIPSVKVPTYDLKPAMSAAAITRTLISKLRTKQYGFALVNYANPDMVGHTGNYKATVTAIKKTDYYLGKLYAAVVEELKGTLVVVSDHGNAEKMADMKLGLAHTAHTTNPVPFTVANKVLQYDPNATMRPGSLADVAPTILALLGLPQPEEMTGQSLLKYEKKYANYGTDLEKNFAT
jgi:2,3-bisphosphoglycerate-independent phosphoglycerate mutase